MLLRQFVEPINQDGMWITFWPDIEVTMANPLKGKPYIDFMKSIKSKAVIQIVKENQ